MSVIAHIFQAEGFRPCLRYLIDRLGGEVYVPSLAVCWGGFARIWDNAFVRRAQLSVGSDPVRYTGRYLIMYWVGGKGHVWLNGRY